MLKTHPAIASRDSIDFGSLDAYIYTDVETIVCQSGVAVEVKVKRLGELEGAPVIPDKEMAFFVLQIRDSQDGHIKNELTTTEWDPLRFWNNMVPIKGST